MVKIKVDDENETIEVEEDLDEDLEEDLEEEEEAEVEDEGGIFDEDLILEDSEDVSDFFIGDTILSSAEEERTWSKEDLEEVLRNERIEKDWGDSEEFVGSDFYNATTGDFYKSREERDGFYEVNRGDDLYKSERGSGDLYNTGEVGSYIPKANEEGVYDVTKRGMKSYDEVMENRRKGRSVLEMAGFEDKEKQKDRDTHSLMKYEAKKAA
jgi:hypothetical protein